VGIGWASSSKWSSRSCEQLADANPWLIDSVHA
jgi:hypothetical protein